MSKVAREMQLQRSNDVYHVRGSALLELCPLEDEDPRNEAAPPQLQTPGHDDFRINPLTMRKRRTFRAWCAHCVKGLARDWPHRSDYGHPPDIPVVAMDFCFANTESDDDVLTILTMKEEPCPISWSDGAARQICK